MDITVTLQVKELIFDVQNKTYLTGRAREAETKKNYEAASNMQASDDDENSYQVRRSISNAFSDLKTALAEYLADDTAATDNLVKAAIDTSGALTLSLKMPSNYNPSATDNLGAALHQYIVCSAIADWFTITNKEDAADYKALAQQSIDTARRALYKRQRPQRPVYGA